jgi:hypothetical protein
VNTDISFLHDLRADLAQATRAEAGAHATRAEAGAHATAARRTRGPRQWLGGRRRVLVVAAGLVCAGGAAIAVVIVGSLGTGHAPSTPSPNSRPTQPSGPGSGILGIPLPPLGKNPFAVGGRRVSLAEATARAGYLFPVPDAPSANASVLSGVWIGPAGDIEGALSKGHREIALQYKQTGVRVFIKPLPRTFPVRALASLKEQARELHGTAKRIGGMPALILTGSGNAWPTGRYTSVQLIDAHSTYRVSLLIVGSPHLPSRQLLLIANSLAAMADTQG